MEEDAYAEETQRNIAMEVELFDNFTEESTSEVVETEKNEGEWNLGYINAVFSAVDFALEYNLNLFTSDEVLMLKKLKDDLSVNAKRILCRLLFRKHKWMKVDSFKFYVQSKSFSLYSLDERHSLPDLVNDAVEELITKHYLLSFSSLSTSSTSSSSSSSHVTFDDCWEIANQLLSFEEWQLLFKFLFANRLSKFAVINSKKDLMEEIKKLLLTQRTFYGTTLKSKFPELFIKFLNTNHNKENKEKLAGSMFRIVQLKKDLLIFMKRILRLYQVHNHFFVFLE
jgi:hypothetical protein